MLFVEVICMLEVVFSIFTSCLAVLGLVEVFRLILFLFTFKKKDSYESILIIPIYGKDEKIEMKLRSEISSISWTAENTRRPIFCLDLGMDKETRKICEIFSQEYDFIELCSLDDFNKIIEQSAVT